MLTRAAPPLLYFITEIYTWRKVVVDITGMCHPTIATQLF